MNKKNFDNKSKRMSKKKYKNKKKNYRSKKDKKILKGGTKILKIKFVDFWSGSDYLKNIIENTLKQFFKITYSEIPDILIYSNSGIEYQNKKYKKCCKIYYNGESNIYRNNYNDCNIYLGYDIYDNTKIKYKHYHWMIFLKEFIHAKIVNNLISKNIFNHSYILPRDKLSSISNKNFCCFLVSNGNNKIRNNFFWELSKYKKIDSGGSLFNNINTKISLDSSKRDEENKKWISQYKFMITFENSSVPNYLTEKIIQAYSYGAIPIYWGDPNVTNLVNPKCFINYYDYNDFSKLIEAVKRIDNDDKLYLNMYNQPFFKNPNYLKENNLDMIFKDTIPKIEKLL